MQKAQDFHSKESNSHYLILLHAELVRCWFQTPKEENVSDFHNLHCRDLATLQENTGWEMSLFPS